MSRPEKERLVLSIHEEVVEVLKAWIRENYIDVSLPLLLRFLMTYGYVEVMGGWFVDEAKEAIGVLDYTYNLASDGDSNGRMRVTLTSTNRVLGRFDDPEFTYECIIAGMFALDIGLEPLALEYINEYGVVDK